MLDLNARYQLSLRSMLTTYIYFYIHLTKDNRLDIIDQTPNLILTSLPKQRNDFFKTAEHDRHLH